MRIDMTASCRSRALRSSCSMPFNRRSCRTGSNVEAVCTSMACVMTSSPTRLMIWSTFSTPTRIVLLVEPPPAGAFLSAALLPAASEGLAAEDVDGDEDDDGDAGPMGAAPEAGSVDAGADAPPVVPDAPASAAAGKASCAIL